MLRAAGAEHGFGVTVRRAGPRRRCGGLFLDPYPRVAESRQAARGGRTQLGRFWEIDGRVTVGDRRGPHDRLSDRQSRSRRISAPGVRGLCGARQRRRPRRRRSPAARSTASPISGCARRSAARSRASKRISSTPTPISTAAICASSLVEFIRPERKFAGLDALKAQIAADAAKPAGSWRRRGLLTERRLLPAWARAGAWSYGRCDMDCNVPSWTRRARDGWANLAAAPRNGADCFRFRNDSPLPPLEQSEAIPCRSGYDTLEFASRAAISAS